MVRAVRERLPILVRIAAALLALGGVAVGLTLLFPVIPPTMGSIEFIINYTAVLCFVIGLALIWVAKVVNGRTVGARRKSTEK
jgi:protein-S-isoprenylcysteine O-methyltransferase Ste14